MSLARETGLKLDRAYFEALVAFCPDAIIGINRKGIVTLFNEAAENLTGWHCLEVLNKLHVTQLYYPPELARHIKKMIYLPNLGGPGRLKNLEVTLKTKENRTIPILLSAMVLIKKGKEIGSIGFFHDLTRTKHLEEISISDDLTGLHNRYHFYSVLAKEMDRSVRYSRPLSLVYLDLDNFKPFNDNYGHAQGDAILRLVGNCARQLLRVQDTAFRVGGDELALVLIETDLDGARQVADRLRAAFNEQWRTVMSVKDLKLNPVSLSIGVAQYHLEEKDNLPSEDVDNFVKRADMAMYQAKRAGGNCVVKAEKA